MKIFNNFFNDIKNNTIFPQNNANSTQGTQAANISVEGEGETKITSESTDELDEIKVLFEKHDIPLTKEARAAVETFMSSTDGDMETKLQALEIALTKGVDISVGHLRQIHMALTQALKLDYGDLFKSIVPELKWSDEDAVESSDEEPSKSPETLKKNVVHKQLKTLLDSLKKQNNGHHESNKIQQSDKMPNRMSYHTETKNENDLGNLTDELKDVEGFFENLSEHLDEVVEELLPIVNENFFQQPLPSLKMLEITVTEKMIESKAIFDQMQKQMVKQLDQVEVNKMDVKVILSSVIDKLDFVLNKSDVPLFTSMPIERDLIKSSTLLERARSVVEQQPDKAFEMIKDVQKTLERIEFKPSQRKIFVQTKTTFFQELYEQKQIEIVPNGMNEMKTSPRSILDTLRYLGFNHEAEVAETIDKQDKSAFKSPMNIKSILMQLEEQGQKIESKASLDLMTGHQLLNKLEIQSGKQQMFFQIPVQINGVSKNLRVQVNAKKQNEKLDWQNSRLYFVIHLDKLGDTGVLVDINQGQVNITVKNDTPEMEKIFSPFVEEVTKRLESVGFEKANLAFKPLTKVETESIKSLVTVESEGFDVSI
ncbi:MAG: hypothetical protein JXR88_14705 [Clostridia bacterium]|nr:hypothetical protein [Clostridia bacterium]